jgi:hypothetical protein
VVATLIQQAIPWDVQSFRLLVFETRSITDRAFPMPDFPWRVTRVDLPGNVEF